jgi:hypothetical protein
MTVEAQVAGTVPDKSPVLLPYDQITIGDSVFFRFANGLVNSADVRSVQRQMAGDDQGEAFSVTFRDATQDWFIPLVHPQ